MITILAVAAALYSTPHSGAGLEDRIFSSQLGNEFSGQPAWQVAARCASHYQDGQAAVARYRARNAAGRARHPDLASELRDDPEFEAQLASGYEGQAGRFKTIGLLILSRDRPGSGEAVFDLSVAQFSEAERGEPMDDKRADTFDEACRRFMDEAHQIGLLRR